MLRKLSNYLKERWERVEAKTLKVYSIVAEIVALIIFGICGYIKINNDLIAFVMAIIVVLGMATPLFLIDEIKKKEKKEREEQQQKKKQ